MTEQRSAQLAGAATVGAVAVGVAAILLLDGVNLRTRVRAVIYFENIGMLQEGADVQVAGEAIGEVERVRLVSARAITPEHPLAGSPGGGVAVDIAIERRWADRAPRNGEYFINFKGIIGASYLEVGPPPDDQPWGPALASGDELRGVDPPRLDRVLLRSFQNLTSSRLFLRAIAPELSELGGALTRLAGTVDEMEPVSGAYAALGSSIRSASEGADELARALDQIDLAALDRVATSADALIERADRELGELGDGIDRLRANVTALGDKIPPDLRARLKEAADRASQSIDRLRAIAADGRALMAAVDSGEGTVGALLNDPEFIDDAKKLGKILKRQPWRVIGHPPDN